MVAFLSQIISPSQVLAEKGNSFTGSEVATTGTVQRSNNLFELDPDDPNPILFAMARDKPASKNSPLGGPLEMNSPKITASGLSITDLVEGTGAEATAGKRVSVNYSGTLENGKEFDSSYGRGPFSFALGAGQVIKGWDEGVAGMKVGGKRKLIIPPELGYGSRNIGGGLIPPNSTLIFEVELLDIN